MLVGGYCPAMPWQWPVGALCALLLALVTTPAGVSGAVLLLPIQLSVLHVPSPAVTPTNLVFNVAATPGGLLRFWREHRDTSSLLGLLVAGTLPGVVAGAVIRVDLLSGSRDFLLVASCVLLPPGLWLLVGAQRQTRPRPNLDRKARALVWLLALSVGCAGGIYGIGGGSLLAPILLAAGFFRIRGRTSYFGSDVPDVDRGDCDLRDPADRPWRGDRTGLGAWRVARRRRVRRQLPRRETAAPRPGDLDPSVARTDRLPGSTPLHPAGGAARARSSLRRRCQTDTHFPQFAVGSGCYLVSPGSGNDVISPACLVS